MDRLIIGLNTDHGDSSVALIGNDGIIAAIAEERINRKKHCADFPELAIREVLRIAGVDVKDITDIAVARDPKANLMSKLQFIAKHPSKGISLALKRAKVHKDVSSINDHICASMGLSSGTLKAQNHAVEHHLAHIASSYFWSPFNECIGFSVDGAGDFATTMWAECQGNNINIIGRSCWPHSLGVFYTGLCQYMGFDQYGEEYKVMGLSAYGENKFSDLMKRIVTFDENSGLRLNLGYFQHHKMNGNYESINNGVVSLPRLWGDKLAKELGPPRNRNLEITQKERDLAAPMQIRYEEVFLQMVNSLVKRTGERKIVLAGGCALNSVANGRMVAEGLVDQVYFQPAASDDGTAVGAALHVLHSKYGLPRNGEVTNAFWGPEWDSNDIEKALKENGRPYNQLSQDELIEKAAQALSKGKIMGWFQGREEWGPRALGNRSILCNPSWPDMKAILNNRIKNREPFRPFAPVIREEDLTTCFEGSHPVPYMIIVYKVREEWRKKLSAITHEDNTGRVQTVTKESNPILYDLIGIFKEKTGIPVLLNTSFNENEPIVHTPGQAIACFERTKMDCLGIGPFWIEKET